MLVYKARAKTTFASRKAHKESIFFLCELSARPYRDGTYQAGLCAR